MKKHLPALFCALCLALLAGLLGLCFALLALPGPEEKAPVTLYLGEEWGAALLACRDEDARTAHLEATAAQAQSWGCGAVILEVKEKGGLFETGEEALAPAPALEGFDPAAKLKKLCRRAGLALYLLPAGAEGPQSREEAPAWAVALAQKKPEQVLFAGAAPGFATVLAGAPYTNGTLTLLDGISPAALAALRQEGTGGVLGRWGALAQDPAPALRLKAFEAPAEGISLSRLPQVPAICSPAEGAVVYYETLCLAGTSDPALPAALNGGQVTRPGSKGVWTREVTLTPGENTFTLSQGEASHTITVTYKTDGSWTPATPQPDGSPDVKKGRRVRVTADAIASLLEDYTDSSTILETVPAGAVAVVEDCEEFLRSSQYTHAYKVAGGGWLRAEDVELLEKDHPAAGDVVFAGLARTPEEKGETWLLEGPYSPLFRQEMGEDGSLSLIFPACRFEGSLAPAGGLAAGAQVELLDQDDPDAGFALRFEFDPEAPLWGWAAEYAPEGVKITLRGRPELSGDAAAPLAGLTVLLDPGHGGTDNGTAGCAGYTGPLEQELNLLLAQTAKARLEQLGAQVALTRQDAANLTLAQRLERVNFLKPDLFISLHHNSVALTRDTADINGTECFWFTPQSQPLAAALTGRFAAEFGCRDRGAKEDYYFVTRTTVCPAVLLESGFLTTAAEYERCADETGLWAAGGAVAQAVEDFMAGR